MKKKIGADHKKPAYRTPLAISLGGIERGEGQPPCGHGSGASGGGCSPGTGASGGWDSCINGTAAATRCSPGNSPAWGCLSGDTARFRCRNGGNPGW